MYQSYRKKEAHDDTHSFLSVIGTMSERVECRRSKLEPSGYTIHRRKSEVFPYPSSDDKENKSKKSSHKRCEKYENECLGPSCENDCLDSAICDSSSEVSPEECMR